MKKKECDMKKTIARTFEKYSDAHSPYPSTMAKPTIEFSHEITLAWRLGVRGTTQNATFTTMMTKYNLVHLKILNKILLETGIALHHA